MHSSSPSVDLQRLEKHNKKMSQAAIAAASAGKLTVE
jgi:hypothetical protein